MNHRVATQLLAEALQPQVQPTFDETVRSSAVQTFYVAEHPLVFHELSSGQFRFRSRASRLAPYEIGVVRSTHAWTRAARFAYFEATLVKTLSPAAVHASIGVLILSDAARAPSFRHPGDGGTEGFGFWGCDGTKVTDGIAQRYAAKWKQGDIIGCGIDWETDSIFFTLNGKHLGNAFTIKEHTEGFCPAVGLQDPYETVKINWDGAGENRFAFDLAAFEESDKAKNQTTINSTPFPSHEIHALVADYLLHSGYIDTHSAFSAQTGSVAANSKSKNPVSSRYAESMRIAESTRELRRDLRRDILDGDIRRAIERLGDAMPGFMDDSRYRLVALLLSCQEFVELCFGDVQIALEEEGGDERDDGEGEKNRMSGNKRKLSDDRLREMKRRKVDDVTGRDYRIVQMLRHDLGQFILDSPEEDDVLTLVENVASLAAYATPADLPMHAQQLLDPRRRTILADAVNAAVLSDAGHPQSHISALEAGARQLIAAQVAIRGPVGASRRVRKRLREEGISGKDMGEAGEDGSRGTGITFATVLGTVAEVIGGN